MYAIRDLTNLAVMTRDTDPDAALATLETACAYTPHDLTPGDRGEAHFQRALLLHAKGDLRAGLGAVRAARRNFLAAGLHDEAAATEVARAALLTELGEVETALKVCEALLDSLKPSSGRLSESTLTTRTRAEASLTAGIALTKLGCPTPALSHFDQAANIFHATGDLAMVVHTDIHRAATYVSMEMAHQGLAILEGAAGRLKAIGGSVPSADIVVPIAEAYLQLNDPAAAIAALDQARDGMDGKFKRIDAARIQLMLSNALLQAGLVHDARLEAHDASSTFAALEMELELARSLHICGTAAYVLHDFTVAHSELVVAERLSADCDHHAKAGLVVRLTLAWLELSRRNVDRAVEIAESLLAHTDDDTELAIAAAARLILSRAVADPDLARDHLETARQIIQSRHLDFLRLGLVVEMADQQREQGDLAGAARILREAIRTEPENHFAMSEASFYMAHSLVKTVACDELINLLISIGTPAACAEAWQWSTYMKPQRRARLDPTARASGESSDPPPQAVADELFRLSDVYDRHAAPHLVFDQSAIHTAHLASRRTLRRSGTSAAPTLLASGPVVLPSIPEGPILQYHALNGAIVVFVIREGQVYARRVVVGPVEVSNLVRDWHICRRSLQHTLQGSTETTNPSTTSAVLASLYQILVEPIEDLLEGLEGSPLLIVGHRQLHEVPFEALSKPQSDSLIKRFTLRFATALNVSPEWQSRSQTRRDDRSQGARGLLVLSVPDEQAPQIASEAETIARLRPDAEVRVGKDATTELLATRGADFDTIHIASHGIFMSDNPSCSALRLGDRWITAGEIADLDLGGALVVINACAASRGGETAETMDGLAWAFLEAGSRGVVAANWDISDATALAFAEHFHQHVTDGVSPVHSVRLASRDLALSHAHPPAWGAYRYTSAPWAALTDQWVGDVSMLRDHQGQPEQCV